MGEELIGSRTLTAITSSNIGFQLLKKHGWREGSGLGVSEQGRLEPVQAYVKKNKRGLGADTEKKKTTIPKLKPPEKENPVSNDKEPLPSKKARKLSKKMRKLQEFEEQLQEKEFERAFFREFWPDNV